MRDAPQRRGCVAKLEQEERVPVPCPHQVRHGVSCPVVDRGLDRHVPVLRFGFFEVGDQF